MTSPEETRGDYLDFHHQKLLALTSHADRIIDSGSYEYTTVEQPGTGPYGQIVEGEVTTDEVRSDYDDGGGMALEDAMDIAELRNETVLKAAQISFIELQAKATMRHVAEQARMGLLDETTPPSFLSYRLAEKHITHPDDELVVTVTKLHDVEQLGEVAEYDFKLEDGPIQHCLRIETLGDGVIDVNTSTVPVEDEELERWSRILGPEAIGRLFLVLAGRFEDEDKLNDVISDVWTRFIGTGQEEIIVPLLEEVRIRALAAKSAISMAGQFGSTISLPSAESLDEWDQRLARL